MIASLSILSFERTLYDFMFLKMLLSTSKDAIRQLSLSIFEEIL